MFLCGSVLTVQLFHLGGLLRAESFQKKFNRADKEACVVVAKDFSQKLQAAGVSTVQLAGAPKYHGRVKAFIEELRRNGIKC